jgi:flavin reductase (DIM6/NTAB) family NADH-FMN oxidoreductase RutF
MTFNEYDFEQVEKALRYKLMSSIIVPRPIAWIVTEQDGVINIAPFSYFTGVASEPPLVMVSIGENKKELNEQKDTYKNILETKKCVICSVTLDDVEIMDKTAKEFNHNTSEAKELNIELEEIYENFPPMIKSSKTAMFCEFHSIHDIKESPTKPIFLEVKKIITKDEDFDFVARVGKSYGKVEDL